MPRSSKRRMTLRIGDSGDDELVDIHNNPTAEQEPSIPRQWSADDFILGRELGDGQFGRVYQAMERQSGHHIALKHMNKLDLIRNNALMQIKREIEIHSHLIHPNILRLYGFYMEGENIVLIMELLGGSVFNQLKCFGKFTNSRSASILHQIASSLEYLHELDVVHRDIKSENILYSDNIPENSNSNEDSSSVISQSYKLADFGWATYVNRNRRTTLCGTKDFLSPEMILGYSYTTSVDIWSLGCLLYECLVGKPPFDEELYLPSKFQHTSIFGLDEFNKRFIKETSRDVEIYMEDIRQMRSEMLSNKKSNSGDVDFSSLLHDFQNLAASPGKGGGKQTPKKKGDSASSSVSSSSSSRVFPSFSHFTPIKPITGLNSSSSIGGQFEPHATPNDKLKGLPLDEQFKVNFDYQLHQVLPITPSRRAIHSTVKKPLHKQNSSTRSNSKMSSNHGFSRQSASKYRNTMTPVNDDYDPTNPRTWTDEQLEDAVSGAFCPHEVPRYTLKRIVTCDIQYPTWMDPLAIDLISRMLQFDPEKRYTVTDVLAHPYLEAFYHKENNGALNVEEEYQQFFLNGQYSILHYDWVQCYVIRQYLTSGLDYQLPLDFPLHNYNVDELFNIAGNIIEQEEGFDDPSCSITLPPNWIVQREIENIITKNQKIITKANNGVSINENTLKKAKNAVADHQRRLDDLLNDSPQVTVADLLSKIEFTVHLNLMDIISELQDQPKSVSDLVETKPGTPSRPPTSRTSTTTTTTAGPRAIAASPIKTPNKLMSKGNKSNPPQPTPQSNDDFASPISLRRQDSTLHTYETTVAPLRYSSTETHVQLQPQSNPKLTASMKKSKLIVVSPKKRKPTIDPYQLDDDLSNDTVEDTTSLALQIAQLISPSKTPSKSSSKMVSGPFSLTTNAFSTTTTTTPTRGKKSTSTAQEDDLFFKALLHTSIDDEENDISTSVAAVVSSTQNNNSTTNQTTPQKRARRFLFTQKPQTDGGNEANAATTAVDIKKQPTSKSEKNKTLNNNLSPTTSPTIPTEKPAKRVVKPTRFVLTNKKQSTMMFDENDFENEDEPVAVTTTPPKPIRSTRKSSLIKKLDGEDVIDEPNTKPAVVETPRRSRRKTTKVVEPQEDELDSAVSKPSRKQKNTEVTENTPTTSKSTKKSRSKRVSSEPVEESPIPVKSQTRPRRGTIIPSAPNQKHMMNDDDGDDELFSPIKPTTPQRRPQSSRTRSSTTRRGANQDDSDVDDEIVSSPSRSTNSTQQNENRRVTRSSTRRKQ